MEKTVLDRFGNELRCGDNVCFTASSGNWRQTPEIKRARISAFISDRAGDWIVPDDEKTRILAGRVVKCY